MLPRMLSFLLVPLYTSEKVLGSPAEYGTVSLIFSYFVLFNVILAYGMETAFFRFFNKEDDKSPFIDMYLLGHARTMDKETVGLENIRCSSSPG